MKLKWLVIITCMLGLHGCETAEMKDPYVIALNIHENSVTEIYHVDHFDWEMIYVDVIFSDETKISLPVTAAMIDLKDLDKHDKVGSHMIDFSYEGVHSVFPLHLYQSEYDLMLLRLYVEGLEYSFDQVSYESWLFDIQGAPGVSLSEALIDEAGHLIITFSDDRSLDLGRVVGDPGIDGQDGVSIELKHDPQTIYYRQGPGEWVELIDLNALRGLRGFTGARGADGTGIASSEITDDGALIFTYTDDTRENVGIVYDTFTVLFKDMSGSIFDVQYLKKGDDVLAVSPPVIAGHTFSHWDHPLESITASSVVSPVYTKHHFTVTFMQTGDTAVADQTVAYQETLHLIIPTKTDHRFMGWFLGPTVNHQQITESDPVNDDITLYAQWAKDLYTVIFKDDTGEVIQTDYVYYHNDVTPPQTVTKVGHTFTGWNPSPQGITQDTIIEPVFTINDYTVSVTVWVNYEPGDTLPLKDGEQIIHLAAGGSHSGALTSDGRILMWGDNAAGQLGDGTTVSRRVPKDITEAFQLAPNETLVDLQLGLAHSIAFTSLNRVFTWGLNTDFQLGDGTFRNQMTPVDITRAFPAGLDVKMIDANQNQSGLLSVEGALYMWGDNAFGQLGDSTTVNKRTPTKITDQFTLLETDYLNFFALGGTHSGALSKNHEIFMWGENSDKQTTYILTSQDILSPLNVTEKFPLNAAEGFSSLHLGYDHSSVLTTDHRVFMWGDNEAGQLGNNSYTDSHDPIDITASLNVRDDTVHAIQLGDNTTFIWTENHAVFAMGTNASSQLTTSQSANQLTPLDITASFAFSGASVQTLAIGNAVGTTHGLLLTDENVYIWGAASDGQLGNDAATMLQPPGTLNTYQINTYSFTAPYNTLLSDLFSEYAELTGIALYSDTERSTAYTETHMPAHDINVYGTEE